MNVHTVCGRFFLFCPSLFHPTTLVHFEVYYMSCTCTEQAVTPHAILSLFSLNSCLLQKLIYAYIQFDVSSSVMNLQLLCLNKNPWKNKEMQTSRFRAKI